MNSARLTPEAMAREVATDLGLYTKGSWARILEGIRAALAECDAAWATAVDTLRGALALQDPTKPGRCTFMEEDCCDCIYCAPLRALLDAAPPIPAALVPKEEDK